MDNLYEYQRQNKTTIEFPKNPFPTQKYLLPYGNFTLFDMYSPNVAPFSIFPWDEEILIKIMIGSIQIKMVLAEDKLIESFAGKGWTLQFPDWKLWLECANLETPKERRDAVVDQKYHSTLSKNPFYYRVPLELLGKIQAEFLSVKSIVQASEFMMQSAIPGVSEIIVTDYAEESSQWI